MKTDTTETARSAAKAAAGLLLAAAALCADGADVDFGADLRIRQEIMDKVPGLPGGGLLSRRSAGDLRNHMRFRARVWGELKFSDELRVYCRIADAPRWLATPGSNTYRFPDELFLDNLFVEGRGLFDGFLDFTVGRQDVYGADGPLYGLSRVFFDTTPGDGSRSFYSDMARFTLHVSEESSVDAFALFNADRNPLRWGTKSSRNRSLAGLGGGAEPDADEYGAGLIWSSSIGGANTLPYQVFSIYKDAQSCHDANGKRPGKDIVTFGVRLVPQFTEELSAELEGMAQTGRTFDGYSCRGWSGYAAIDYHPRLEWSMKPYANLSLLYLSGDRNTAEENGGHSAWDPLWNRAASPSEMMGYGTNYGLCWWSNLIHPRMTVGVKFGRHHAFGAFTGPMFAAENDGLGHADGRGGSRYMGLLSQLRYDFPLLPPSGEGLGRFEVFGHLLAEFLNPGDYYSTSRPAWFVRWEVTLKF